MYVTQTCDYSPLVLSPLPSLGVQTPPGGEAENRRKIRETDGGEEDGKEEVRRHRNRYMLCYCLLLSLDSTNPLSDEQRV
jgi:hypothetical protein